jgi:SHS2 domain-containing protein
MASEHTYIDHTADILFTASADTLNELFSECAVAVQECMAELSTVDEKVKRTIELRSRSVEDLLFDFLDETLLYKDSEVLIFSSFDVKIKKEGGEYFLSCNAKGEEFDHDKHERKVNVKAITMHLFEVEKIKEKWCAQVLIDI